MNNINKYIEFKMTAEENNTINYLDLTITRYTDWLELDIFHKPTATSTTIHAQSNYLKEHKTAEYRYYIQWLNKLPLSEYKRNKELDIVMYIALDSGYTHGMINHLNSQIFKHKQKNTTQETLHKKWTTSMFFNPAVIKITSVFKNTQLRIAFRPTSTISRYTRE